MPTIIDPIKGHSQTLVTGIYIARGDDTLGPYNSAEAAALVLGGYLRADDYAARDGDTAWVPLAGFLPPDFSPRAELLPTEAPPVRSMHDAHPHRWRRLTTAFAVLLAVPLVVVGGVRWWEGRRAADRTEASPLLTSVQPPAATAPLLPPPTVVAERSVAPTPAPELPGGPLQGSISLALPGGGQTVFAGVRVTAYPLATLENSLAPALAAAQAARDRFDPQVEAAATERSTRLAEEQSALQAWREAAPSDPMRQSLRFAYTGARTSSRTADDNYRYLLNERTAAAGGEVFLHNLPEPTAVAESDTGGHFTLALPTDDTPFAVVAGARSTADDGTARPRYWLVKLSPAQRSGRELLRLDDGNLSSSTAAESLVHTAD